MKGLNASLPLLVEQAATAHHGAMDKLQDLPPSNMPGGQEPVQIKPTPELQEWLVSLFIHSRSKLKPEVDNLNDKVWKYVWKCPR